MVALRCLFEIIRDAKLPGPAKSAKDHLPEQCIAKFTLLKSEVLKSKKSNDKISEFDGVHKSPTPKNVAVVELVVNKYQPSYLYVSVDHKNEASRCVLTAKLATECYARFSG